MALATSADVGGKLRSLALQGGEFLLHSLDCLIQGAALVSARTEQQKTTTGHARTSARHPQLFALHRDGLVVPLVLDCVVAVCGQRGELGFQLPANSRIGMCRGVASGKTDG